MNQPSEKPIGDATNRGEQEQKHIGPISPVSQRAVSSTPSNRLTFGVIAARFTLALLCGASLFLSVLPAGHVAARTALLVAAVVSASEPAPLLLLGDPVQHIQKTIPSPEGTVYLDIYEPATPVPLLPGVREGLVIIPGVGDNRQDPQLINLSLALAHSGIVVENITTPTLINNDISAGDSDAVVQAFTFLSHWPGVGADRVGIAGFSGGGSLACLAAADPRIGDRVSFLALFGTYFNAETVLRAYGRRAITVDGHTVPWYPSQYPLQVLADVMADGLPPGDGSLLVSAFVLGGKPLTGKELMQMSPSAVAAYHLLKGDEPNRVQENIVALSPQLHTLLNMLSPSSVITKIHAPIYLLHSRDDSSLPVTESQVFAATLARIHHPYDFVQFGIFQHVQVEANPSITQLLSDTPSLFRVLYEVLLPGS
jgi:acetyl esterase/lipase